MVGIGGSVFSRGNVMALTIPCRLVEPTLYAIECCPQRVSSPLTTRTNILDRARTCNLRLRRPTLSAFLPWPQLQLIDAMARDLRRCWADESACQPAHELAIPARGDVGIDKTAAVTVAPAMRTSIAFELFAICAFET